MFYCCVPGCFSKGKTVPMHRFPKTEDLCRIWIQLIGAQEKLINKSVQEIRLSYRICDNHFDDASRISNGKGRWGSTIKADAIPSLHLPSNDKENQDPVEPVLIDQPSTSKILPYCSPSRSSPKSPQLSGKCQILRSTGVEKLQDLSPKSRILHKYASKLKAKARQQQRKLLSTKAKLTEAIKFANSPNFMRAKLNEQSYNFLLSQLKLQKIVPRGRRFSLNDKILALTLYKQSPKSYKLLRKIFALPSRTTLSNLLQKVPFQAGLNVQIFSVLEKTCQSMEDIDRYCSIIFDEMAIEPGLYYNKADDFIEGFKDNGFQRNVVFADKVMVFMATGIHKKWKQPLAYFFNGGGMKTEILVKVLKDVVRSVRLAGLKVATIVCDQGATNRSAINYLYKETEAKYIRKREEKRIFGIEVDGVEIVPIYDVPHLLKCVRNILFDSNITYTWRNGENKIAQWKHIRRVYELEDPAEEYKLCHKLTEVHVENTKKMKVSVAAQVFSCRVAAAMKSLTQQRGDVLEPNAIDTAEFIVFMDKTFDSLNGSRITPEGGKLLRTAVSKKSAHYVAVRVFSSVKCNNEKRKNFIPPTFRNWVHTLKAFEYICTKLLNCGFKFVCPRNFNQDPLENFFGSIRSYRIRNINPDCHSFKNLFKSLIINNFMSKSSYNKNCEDDNLKSLNNLRDFLTSEDTVIEENIDVTLLENPPERIFESDVLTYIAGYIAKKNVKKGEV